MYRYRRSSKACFFMMTYKLERPFIKPAAAFRLRLKAVYNLFKVPVCAPQFCSKRNVFTLPSASLSKYTLT